MNVRCLPPDSQWVDEAGNRETTHMESHDTTDATLALDAGGKSLSHRQNFFEISATADSWRVARIYPGDEYSQVYADIRDLGKVDSTTIKVDGMTLGSDGVRWRIYADNDTRDVTPRVKGNDYYTFNVPPPTKYHLYIGLGTSTTNANLDTDTPEVCVGQTVNFNAYWQGGSSPPSTSADIRWHLPDKYVNEQYPYSSTCTTYIKNTDLLTNAAIQCWYVNKPGGACSVREILQFANGQSAIVAAAGSFTVYRPNVNPPINHGPFGAGLDAGLLGGELNLMNDSMWFDVTINSKYPGNFGLTQLVNFNALPPGLNRSTYGSFWLDGTEYYDGPVEIGQQCSINDEPGVPLLLFYGSYNGNWQVYVRFTPNGGIPVTLNRIDWNWAATAENPGTGWYITSDHVDNPQLYYDDSFPVWSNVKPAPEDQ